MNRFLLFAYMNNEVLGGIDDCVLMSNEWDEIRDRWQKLTADHSHVYDCESGRVYTDCASFVERFG